MRRLLVPAVLLVASCSPAAPPPPPAPAPPIEAKTALPEPRSDGRLPELARPRSYALELEVDPEMPRFRGKARIEIDVPERTSYVVLHAHALAVSDARVTPQGGAPVPARTSVRAAHGAKDPEELVLALDRALPPGTATIEIVYEAPFDDELSGFYRVKDGGRSYVFSQLEATDARRAFPCFDEPGFKTPFEVSVLVPRGQLAISNAPERAREERERGTLFRFAPTRPLPTYLVALAVGDFEIRTTKERSHPPIRLVTTRGKSGLGDVALEDTSALVDVLARYVGVPYPYEKLDIVAVPELAAGAMENAGLVTFREEVLLVDPAHVSARARRNQAATIAHELAHQWFGDLVTATWWNDIWLNEGMATWMESRALESYRPAWNTRTDALLSALSVMDDDALAAARAVRQPVSSTSDAHEAFDSITYEKGAAVLGTIERWIGEDAFRRGIATYLAEHAHANVTSSALFRALDRVSGKDVTAMASAYLDHPGVPEIGGSLSCEASGRWNVELNQERYRPLGSAIPESGEHTWVLPVCVSAQGDREVRCAELTMGAPSLVAARGACPTWVHPNVRAGYYRFSLGDAETIRLAEARPRLEPGARLSVLSNAWAATRAGKLKAATLLRVLASTDGDETRGAAEALQDVLSSVEETLVEDDAREAFRKFVHARFARRKKDLGWEASKGEEPGGERALARRSVLFALADLAGDEATLREAEPLAARWLADPTSVDADAGAIALELASRRAGPARIEELRAAMKRARTRDDRLAALRALAGFDDPKVLERALDVSLGEDVQANEVRYTLRTALARPASRRTAEAWVRSRWDALRKKLPGSLGGTLVAAARVACTKAEVEERRSFYGPRAADIEGAARSAALAIEEATLCAALRESAAPSFARALRGEKEPKPSRR